MGIQVSSIVEGKDISLEELFDKHIAIDSFNWIYQFLTIIRQPDGEPLMDSSGNITSHLSGLFYRTIKLFEAGIHPIYVFDGEPPALKKETTEQRRDVREEARKEWKQALERKDYEAARKYAKRSATITDDMIKNAKKLLDAMGVAVVQAPSEGEALCSLMCKNSDAYAVATQDYDSLMFAAPRLIRNLSITGKRKRGDSYITINPEIILLKDVLERLGIDQGQFIMLGILIGTDYNPGGIAGYGPKKALERVKEMKNFDAIFEGLVWDFQVTAEEIFEFFKNPLTSDYNIKFRELDAEKVKSILCDEHEFSEERIDSALKRLEQSKKDQKSLNRWF